MEEEKKQVEAKAAAEVAATKQGTVEVVSARREVATVREQNEKLESQVNAAADEQICSICMVNQKDRVLDCGHRFCNDCCDRFKDCPVHHERFARKVDAEAKATPSILRAKGVPQ